MLRIREVLSRLLHANLKLNPEKCQFFKKSVTFLGHIISDQGVSTDPEKIQAITTMADTDKSRRAKEFPRPGLVLQEVY